MNKLRYRLVFNQARGMLMAVAEHARSHGKGPGESAAPVGAQAGAAPPPLRRLALLVAMAVGGALAPGVTLAQVVADRNVPGQQQATVLRTANGVLQVNVQTPSAAGVSRNVYTQFDVPRDGVVLNNARADVQTQLGGWVQANPWMKEGSARVILNEVNSRNPSRLQGFIEVAGPRAETVIANPAGIVVDGGGFINVSRATLTTGTARMSDGQLTGFDVQRGQIAIEGAGLNAGQADYTALIARSVQLNAGLWAQQLNVVAGVNTVTYADLPGVMPGTAPQDGAAVPSYAIDVARLGGMYANHIWLVGTEAGVGVRNAGEIGAAAGELVVTSSGRLENLGSLDAGERLALTAPALRNTGEVSAQADARFAIDGVLDNSGGLLEAGRLEIAAAGLVNRDGSIVQRGATALALAAQQVSNSGGTLGQAAPVTAAPEAGGMPVTAPGAATPPPASEAPATVTPAPASTPTPAPAPTAPAPATVLADGTLKAALIDNDGGLISASGGVRVKAGNFDNHSGKAHLDSLDLAGKAFDNDAGTLQVRGALQAQTDSFSNRNGALLVGGAAQVVTNRFDNRAGLLQAGALALQAGTLDNSAGTLRHTGADAASVRVEDALRQDAGTIDVAAALALRAGQISGARGVLNVAGDLDLVSGAASATGASWRVGGGARIRTGTLDSRDGTISTQGELVLDSAAIDNGKGRIVAGLGATVRTEGDIDNTGGLIQADSALDVTAGGALGNRGGAMETLAGRATLAVAAATIDNTAGRLVNAGDGAARIAAGAIDSDGLIGSNGSLAIDAARLANRSTGRIVAAADMTLSVSGLLANAGNIAGGAGMAVRGAGARLENSGAMLAQRGLDIDNGAIANRGTIATASGGQGALTVRTGSLDNAGGALQADRDARIVVSGQVGNAGGTIDTGATLLLQAGGDIDNRKGSMVGGTQIDIAARNIDNAAGKMVGAGQGDSAVMARGTIDNGGTLAARGKFTVGAQVVENRADGEIVSDAALQVDVTGQLHNQGRISSATMLTFMQDSASLVNGGNITAGGALHMALDGIDNRGGSIVTLAGAGMTLAARTVDNRGGRVTSGGAAAIDVAGAMDNAGGLIQANGALRAEVGAHLRNDDGVIELLGGAGMLDLGAGSIDNLGGRIVNVGGGATTVRAARHIANSGLIVGNGAVTLEAATVESRGEIRSGGVMELAVNGMLDNRGTISAAGGLHADQAQAALRNSSVIVAGGALDMTWRAIDNTGGKIATAHGGQANLALRAGHIVNQDGAIMADGAAQVTASGDIDNTGGLVQARTDLALDAGGTLDNSRGAIETLLATSTLAVNTGALRNDAGRIVNVGSGESTVRAATTLDNSGLIAGNGKLAVEAHDARNGADGVIAAGAALGLAIHGSLDNAGTISSRTTLDIDAVTATVKNSGTMVAGADAAIRAGALNNDGGQIVAAQGSGASLALAVDSLSNRGGRIMSEDALALAITGALDNARGTLQGVTHVDIAAGGMLGNDAGLIEASGPASQLALQAGAIANGSGRIVNVGLGAAIVSSTGAIANNGTIAGNGALALSAGMLDNGAQGTVASGEAMTIAIGTALDNAGAINSGATLDIAAQDAAVRNSGLVVARGALTLRSGELDNDGGQLATAKSSGAGLTIDAAAISNRQGVILADADASVTAGGDIDNRSGTLQAAGSLALAAGGAVRNDAGVIEALGPNATLAVAAQTLDNGAGRLVNVGSGATTLTSETLSNRGLVAGNGQVAISAGSIDNGATGTLAAGGGLEIDARTRIANAGMISSHDELVVRAGTASVRNSGQIVSGAAATLATGAFDNSGGQLVTTAQGGADIVLSTRELVNAGGAIVAAGAAHIRADGTLDNSAGSIRAADALALDAGGSMLNHGGTIEATGAAATLALRAQAVDNGNGRLVNAGSGDTRIEAAGSIANAGLIAGNGKLDLLAQRLHNAAAGTLAAGAAMDLQVSSLLDNAGAISSAGALRMDQLGARIVNSGKMAVGAQLALHANEIVNDGGQIATAGGAAITLHSATRLSNRGGAIAAAGDATLNAAGAIDNSGGQVQTPGRLTVTAGGALDNAGGAFEARGPASTLAMDAAAITSSGRIVNSGAGATTINGRGGIVNSGTIGGNGALDLLGATLRNSAGGTIVAGSALELAIRQQLDNAGGSISSGGTLHFDQAGATFVNSGRIGAGGAIGIRAASIGNDGGQLYTSGGSGATIALDAGSLSNLGGKVAADGVLDIEVRGALGNHAGTLHGGHGLALNVGQALANGSGTIEAAGGTLDVKAASIASSGRIVNGGSGATRVTGSTGIVNSGAIAGNGALAIDTQTPQNDASGQIGAGGAMLLDVRQSFTNTGGVSSAGTLTFNQSAAGVINSGQIDAGGHATFVAASFKNDGGRISTVKGSGADIHLTAPGLSNRNGAILADGKASLTLDGALDNAGGTLQAGSALVIAAKGALGNDGGAIEALGADATLRIDSAAIDNGSGRITNLGKGDTTLASAAGIVNNGVIAAMGNLLLSGHELQNGAAATLASGGNLTLAIDRQWTNAGKVNSGGTLTFDQAGAVFVNSGQVLAGGHAVIRARNVNNDGGQLGTGDGSGADLALSTEQLSNAGGRIATDRDLIVSTRAMTAMGALFGGRDLALAMDGDYVHGAAAQQFQSNRDLSLTVTGNITNTAAFQAAGKLTLSGQQIANQAGATIEAQGVALKASGDLTNAGEIQGATTLEVAAANVRNTGAIVGGAVTLVTGNLDNTGSAALIGATGSLGLGVNGALNNTGGATLYSSGSLGIGAASGGNTALVNNHSSTIEAGGDLAMQVGTLRNVRDNVRIEQVRTVDETVNMSLPGWYSQGDNPEHYDDKSANYFPREVYFVDPADILEETPFVRPTVTPSRAWSSRPMPMIPPSSSPPAAAARPMANRSA